jgi:hypothetical protein
MTGGDMVREEPNSLVREFDKTCSFRELKSRLKGFQERRKYKEKT